MSLTRAQVDTLLNPIKARRVMQAQGQSHVAAFDIIAHLTRIFGFGGWSKEILDLSIVHERSTDPELAPNGQPKNQGRWWVTYSCTMRLTIFDPDGNPVAVIEDAATGSAQNMPSPADAFDFAIKNAVSYALKRCAKDLGDQFGLSLYNEGQTAPLIGRTLVMPAGDAFAHDVEEHAPAPLVLGNDERAEPTDDADHAPEHDGEYVADGDQLADMVKARGISVVKAARVAAGFAESLGLTPPPNLSSIDDKALLKAVADWARTPEAVA